MKIGTEHKVESDPLNIILYERHISKKSGKERWEAIGYFTNVKNLLTSLADTMLRESGFKDLKTIAKKQEEIYALIDSLTIPEKL